jgi:hypothetical protein
MRPKVSGGNAIAINICCQSIAQSLIEQLKIRLYAAI